MRKLTSLYHAAKRAAARREEVYQRFVDNGHPDAGRIYNFENHVVNNLLRDYYAGGGKRNLEYLKAEDKEVAR